MCRADRADLGGAADRRCHERHTAGEVLHRLQSRLPTPPSVVSQGIEPHIEQREVLGLPYKRPLQVLDRERAAIDPWHTCTDDAQPERDVVVKGPKHRDERFEVLPGRVGADPTDDELALRSWPGVELAGVDGGTYQPGHGAALLDELSDGRRPARHDGSAVDEGERLRGPFGQSGEGTVGRAGVAHPRGIVEIEDHRRARSGDQRLDDGRTGQHRLALHEHGIVTSRRGDVMHAASKASNHAGHRRRDATPVVQRPIRRCVEEGRQVHVDPPRRQRR